MSRDSVQEDLTVSTGQKETLGPLRFVALLSECDGKRKEQNRCRLWEECLYHMEKKWSEERRGLTIRGETRVVFGLKSPGSWTIRTGYLRCGRKDCGQGNEYLNKWFSKEALKTLRNPDSDRAADEKNENHTRSMLESEILLKCYFAVFQQNSKVLSIRESLSLKTLLQSSSLVEIFFE